jgi:dihydropteroate synthase
MGVLNVTPDSFSDGGLWFDRERAVEYGLAMAREGADILDVGGESTRPYSAEVSIEEEKERVIPVIERLAGSVSIPISIDTTKAEVARAALEAGAGMVNDVSAMRFDPDMASVVAEAGVPVVLMHMKGTPGNMQDAPVYTDLMGEIRAFLEEAAGRALNAGIREELVLIDPGVGFGKTFDHNLQIIRDLERLLSLNRPVVLGCSRKAFIGHLLGREPEDRDPGSMAAVAAGVMNGAHVVRVHNVPMGMDTVRMVDAVKRGRIEPAGA